MIALEVSLNGRRVCLAGADDLAVLSAHVTACGKLGSKTVPARPDDTTGEIHYSVGGLTARPDPKKDVHMRWKSVAPLRVGDIIQVKIVETTVPTVRDPRLRFWSGERNDMAGSLHRTPGLRFGFNTNIIGPASVSSGISHL